MDMDKFKDEIYPILKKYNVKRASLFGSVARGEERGDSDIDLLVEFEGRKSLLGLVGLKIELEERLKREVDVLTYNSLHPLIKERVLREKIDIL